MQNRCCHSPRQGILEENHAWWVDILCSVLKFLKHLSTCAYISEILAVQTWGGTFDSYWHVNGHESMDLDKISKEMVENGESREPRISIKVQIRMREKRQSWTRKDSQKTIRNTKGMGTGGDEFMNESPNSIGLLVCALLTLMCEILLVC